MQKSSEKKSNQNPPFSSFLKPEERINGKNSIAYHFQQKEIYGVKGNKTV